MDIKHIPTLSGIYRITNTVGGKCYVGSAKNIKQRLYYHVHSLDRGTHKNRYLQNAWKTYGASAFVADVLETVDDLDELLAREQFHLDALDVCNREIGYNLHPFATRGSFLEETRQRMSAALKGRKKSPEHCKRIAEARAKQDPRSLSHPHTEETKAFLKARVLPPATPEQCRKISEALKGRKGIVHTEETKAKLAAKARERGPLSEAHRKALSEGQKRRGARGPHSAERCLNISLAKKRAFAARRAAAE